MTPREFGYQKDGYDWRWERETLHVISALVGKTPDELLGRTQSSVMGDQEHDNERDG